MDCEFYSKLVSLVDFCHPFLRVTSLTSLKGFVLLGEVSLRKEKICDTLLTLSYLTSTRVPTIYYNFQVNELLLVEATSSLQSYIS